MRTKLTAALVAGWLAACGTPEPDILISLPVAPTLPAECTKASPSWAEPPDGELRRTAAARLWRENKERFQSMRSDRQVCRAAVLAAAEVK